MRRWNPLFLIFLVAVLVFIRYYYYSLHHDVLIQDKQQRSSHHHTLFKSRERKGVITYVDMPWYYNLSEGDHYFKSCKISNCILRTKKEEIVDSDIVLFYTHNAKAKHPPVKKQENQTWIFFSVESPINSQNKIFGTEAWRNAFNLTMTYRLDSDYRFGYGRVLPIENAHQTDYGSVMKTKTKLVAWLVSHCNTQSNRQKYVDILKTQIPVHIYGKCGKMSCPVNGDCKKMISKTYKFYLAFENSFCKDYVTEKVYEMLRFDIVPIVRGGANYSYLFPKKSVINTADFKSIKDLSDYIKFLDKNPVEYLKYFEWKKHHVVSCPDPFEFCRLCKQIHFPSGKKKWYENIDIWWQNNTCSEPTDIF